MPQSDEEGRKIVANAALEDMAEPIIALTTCSDRCMTAQELREHVIICVWRANLTEMDTSISDNKLTDLQTSFDQDFVAKNYLTGRTWASDGLDRHPYLNPVDLG